MSTYHLIDCIFRGAICSDARKVISSVRQALSSFAMPLWFCAIILLSVSLPAHGTSVIIDSTDSKDRLNNSNAVCVFTETLLFPKASSVVLQDFARNRLAIDSIYRFFSVTDTRNLIDIKLIGSYSPEGKKAFNINLAEARARALDSIVRKIDHSVNPKLSISHPASGQTANYRSLRSAELQVVYLNTISARDMSLLDTVCRKEGVEATGASDNVMAEQCVSDTTSQFTPPNTNNCESNSYICNNHLNQPLSEHDRRSSRCGLFATTNLLYDAAITPNIGVGISIGDRVILLADWMYARWSNHDKRRYWRIYGGDLELKYHVGNIRKNSPLGGHHVGVYASLACYDFQAGLSHKGILSDKYNYAVGVSYTYTLPVATRLNIDFNLGVGYLWGKFKKHTPIDECDVWQSTHRLRWMGPTRVGVSLVWLLGDPCANREKGGER